MENQSPEEKQFLTPEEQKIQDELDELAELAAMEAQAQEYEEQLQAQMAPGGIASPAPSVPEVQQDVPAAPEIQAAELSPPGKPKIPVPPAFSRDPYGPAIPIPPTPPTSVAERAKMVFGTGVQKGVQPVQIGAEFFKENAPSRMKGVFAGMVGSVSEKATEAGISGVGLMGDKRKEWEMGRRDILSRKDLERQTKFKEGQATKTSKLVAKHGDLATVFRNEHRKVLQLFRTIPITDADRYLVNEFVRRAKRDGVDVELVEEIINYRKEIEGKPDYQKKVVGVAEAGGRFGASLFRGVADLTSQRGREQIAVLGHPGSLGAPVSGIAPVKISAHSSGYSPTSVTPKLTRSTPKQMSITEIAGVS